MRRAAAVVLAIVGPGSLPAAASAAGFAHESRTGAGAMAVLSVTVTDTVPASAAADGWRRVSVWVDGKRAATRCCCSRAPD